MSAKDELVKKERTSRIDHENLEIEDNKKNLEMQREKLKDQRVNAKKHWDEELERVTMLKKIRLQEEANDAKLQPLGAWK